MNFPRTTIPTELVARRCVRFAILWITICGCGTSHTSDPSAALETTGLAVPSEDWGGLQVRFAGADIKDAKRVVVLLHGYGAPGDDLVSLADFLDAGDTTAFVFPQAPIALDGGGFAWTTGSKVRLEQSCDQILAIVDRIKSQNLDCFISVGGFSQGATISTNLLSEQEGRLDSVLLYSPANTLVRIPVYGDTSPRVFLAHGRDDEILPFFTGRR